MRRREAIDQDLKAIDVIWKEKSVPVGEFTAFRAVHVRKEITRPLDFTFSKDQFEKLVGVESVGMASLDSAREIRDVHAARVAGFLFYAQIQAGKIVVFGLEQESEERMDGESAERIAAFVDEHELVLVHWRSRTVLDSSDKIVQYLTGKKGYQALQTTPMTRSVYEKTIEFGDPQRGA